MTVELEAEEPRRIRHPIKAKIGLRRVNNLPYKEKGGRESPLKLPDGSCLYEPSHFVLFKNNVLGMEYNHYGPRASALKEYLLAKNTERVQRLTLLPLLNPDVVKKLKSFETISLFRMSVHRDAIRQIRFSQSLREAFEVCSKATEAEKIEVIFRSARKKKYAKAKNAIDAKEIASWLIDSRNIEDLDKLAVKGTKRGEEKPEAFDILADKVISKKKVVKEDPMYRHVMSKSMYKAIEAAYKEKELERVPK